MKRDDHGMDALRYLVMGVDRPSGVITDTSWVDDDDLVKPAWVANL